MSTITTPRASWDQIDYEVAVENLEREIQGLAVALRERGVSFPERPATAKGGHDVVAQYEALMVHASKCRMSLSFSKPVIRANTAQPQAKLVATPAQAPGAHQVKPKSAAAPQKPRTPTLTEKCRAANARK